MTLALPGFDGQRDLVALAAPARMISEYMFGYTQPFAENLGYSEGQGYGTVGGVVVLDFGSPALPGRCGPSGTDRGTLALDNSTWLCDNEVAGLMEAFARGFYNGLQSVAPGSTKVSRIAMGTNNNSSVTDTTAGVQWGQWVQAANAWLTDVAHNGGADYSRNVVIIGAIDIEGGFASSNAGSRQFIDGYGSVTSYPLYNYGDCAGCPFSYKTGDGNPTTSPGWTLDDEWYDSWGGAAVWPLPEIYFTLSGIQQHDQWESVSLYNQIQKGAINGQMLFEGSFAQYQKCIEYGFSFPGCTITNQQGQQQQTLSSSASWTALYNALQSDARTAMTPPFVTDIRDAQ